MPPSVVISFFIPNACTVKSLACKEQVFCILCNHKKSCLFYLAIPNHAYDQVSAVVFSCLGFLV